MIARSLDPMLAYIKAGEPELTTRQLALLLIIHSQPSPHTVRGLARQLGVQKPIVTRALTTLGGLGFTQRRRDDADRRNVHVTPTADGHTFLQRNGFIDQQVAAA